MVGRQNRAGRTKANSSRMSRAGNRLTPSLAAVAGPWQTTGTAADPDPADWSATLGIEDWPTNRSLRALELLGADPAISLDELLTYKHDLRYHPDSDVAQWRDLLVASLDPALRHSVMRHIESLNRDEGMTVICTLHDVDLVQRYATLSLIHI